MLPQLLRSRNALAFVPPSAIELMVTAAEPVFVSVTGSTSLVVPVTVTGNASDAGLSVTVCVAAAVAVPFRATNCGEPVALSATESDAVSAPATVGLNSIETVQLAAAASEVVHVVADFTNEVALVPVSVSEVNVTAAVLVFLIVTTCAAVVAPTTVEAKVNVVGESVTVSVAAVPVPERATVCGEPVALSATESEAVLAPADAGLNSIDTVQLALAANEAPHVVADFTNEDAFVPVRVSEVSVTVEVPVFLIVTTCAAVVAPTAVEAKVSVAGETETVSAAAVPEPVSFTVCGEPVALSAIDRLAVSVPAAAGLNSTETVQLAPAANEVVQVLAEITNEDVFVPVNVSEVSVNAAVPVFFTVTT